MREGVVLDLQLDVFAAHVGQLGLEHELVLVGLEDVDRRNPRAAGRQVVGLGRRGTRRRRCGSRGPAARPSHGTGRIERCSWCSPSAVSGDEGLAARRQPRVGHFRAGRPDGVTGTSLAPLLLDDFRVDHVRAAARRGARLVRRRAARRVELLRDRVRRPLQLVGRRVIAATSSPCDGRAQLAERPLDLLDLRRPAAGRGSR